MHVTIAHRHNPISQTYTMVSRVALVTAEEGGGFCYRLFMADGSTATFHCIDWEIDAVEGGVS